ncbi:HNH endonuclease [Paracoccaceae bacterium]|nr:HNH endonuclease [Paracoccaceae bacterium]
MIRDLDIKKVKELYQQGKSLRQIGTLFKVSPKTVERRLKSEGILLRAKNHSDNIKNSWWQQKTFLRDKYLGEELSTTQIGKIVNASPTTVHRWLVEFNIPTRPTGGSYKQGTKMSAESRKKMSEAKKGKYSGSDNPNWKGAEVSEDIRERRSYQSKVWRKACLERDDNCCTICASTERLHVHHILEYKDYPDRRWDINNGKTVCAICHEKIHNRTFPDWVTGRATTKALPIKNVKIADQHTLEINPSILKWLYEGNSTAVIAKMFGFNDETVRKKLIKLGIRRSKAKNLIPDKNDLLRVYAENNLIETGQHFQVGQTTVHKWLKHYAIPRRPNGKRRK